MFFSECDSDDEESRSENGHDSDGEEHGGPSHAGRRPPACAVSVETREDGSISPESGGIFSSKAWARYFHPVFRGVYWRSLIHLVAVNFPFALLAWVYLFVFTVVRLIYSDEIT